MRATRHPVLLRGSSTVWVEGDATFGRFRGEDTEVEGWATFSEESGNEDARGRVTIEVSGFHTGKGLRDRHLREALDAERFPVIEFTLRAVDSIAAAAADGAGLVGTLTIHGAARIVSIPTQVEQRGDSVHVSGRLSARFTEFDMQPPQKLIGTVRVDDALVIGFDAVFLPSEPE